MIIQGERKNRSEDSAQLSSPGTTNINNNDNINNNNYNNYNNRQHGPNIDDGPQISEFVVSVSAVLETTGVNHSTKAQVMGVVSRLVDRLNRVEEEKDSANMQLKGLSCLLYLLQRNIKNCTRVKKS